MLSVSGWQPRGVEPGKRPASEPRRVSEPRRERTDGKSFPLDHPVVSGRQSGQGRRLSCCLAKDPLTDRNKVRQGCVVTCLTVPIFLPDFKGAARLCFVALAEKPGLLEDVCILFSKGQRCMRTKGRKGLEVRRGDITRDMGGQGPQSLEIETPNLRRNGCGSAPGKTDL